MAKKTKTTDPLSPGRLKDRVHSKRDLFLIGIQVVLSFMFLLKCSQDIVQVVNGTTGTLIVQEAKGHTIRGPKHKRKLIC